MTAILFLDDRSGRMFNKRRQSRDSRVKEAIQQLCAGKRVWMNAYSARLYADMEGVEVCVDENFLQRAGADDFCLVEAAPLKPVEEEIARLIVFFWNRTYPADIYFDLDFQQWVAVSEEEFPGSSHEKITQTIYVRKDVTQ